MIRMVNLTCLKCGMSLDVGAAHVQRYCPLCGGKLFISVNQMIDILDEKQEIKESLVKYEKRIKLIKFDNPKRKRNLRWIWITLLVVLIFAMFGAPFLLQNRVF